MTLVLPACLSHMNTKRVLRPLMPSHRKPFTHRPPDDDISKQMVQFRLERTLNIVQILKYASSHQGGQL